MNDQSIAASVIQYLQKRGAVAISQQQPAGLLILAHYRGVFLAVQIRKPGKRMTNQQARIQPPGWSSRRHPHRRRPG